MYRAILCSVAMLAMSLGCKDATDKKAKEATIIKMDAKNRSLAVKLQSENQDVDKTFQLAETIEYMDDTGKVVDADIFTSGDQVLIFEGEGTITRLKKKAKADVAKQADGKDKTAQETKAANETFLRAADQMNLADVQLGKLAEGRGASDAVKKFGEQAARDHALMNKELRSIASKHGIALAEKLDQRQQELVDELTKLKGAAFDQAYTKDMVSDHEKAIDQFEIAAKHGGDADVKAWAAKCLPTLREHLKSAQAAVKTVNGK